MKLIDRIKKLRPQLARAAQGAIDAWDQDDEGLDDELGEGGVCDQVAANLGLVIMEACPDVTIAEGGHDGDEHAWVIAYDDTDAVGVDVPPGVYETGGGYRWKKIKGAVVRPSDVEVWKLNRRDVAAPEREENPLGRAKKVVKRCACGKAYTETSWKRLPLVRSEDAPRGRLDGLEYRDCSCGSTLARPYGRASRLRTRKANPSEGKATLAERVEYAKTHWGRLGTGRAMKLEAVDVSDPKTELVVLGVLTEIVYATEKGNDPGMIEYEHKFSKKDPPLLAYDRKSRKLVICGGEYRVEWKGIVK